MIGVDLVYGRETRFQKIFREAGQEAVGGLSMLIAQAARAWERWTGQKPNRSVMESAVQERGN
jgi:shikimate 5-dehydrogenase